MYTMVANNVYMRNSVDMPTLPPSKLLYCVDHKPANEDDSLGRQKKKNASSKLHILMHTHLLLV